VSSIVNAPLDQDLPVTAGALTAGGHPPRQAAVEHVWSETISRVDRVYYEEIAGVLRGLLIRLDDRLPAKDVTLIAEFIDANELGLVLEQIADVLSEDEQPLAAGERADMLKLCRPDAAGRPGSPSAVLLSRKMT
jgi:hypothetical protein